MRRIFKYLKPFAGGILACVVLVFLQAMCDLRLPDYMSNIVNVGIQQGGVEDAVPDVIRQSEMENLLLFMNEADSAKVMEHYTLQDSRSTAYDTLVSKYPALAKQPLYVLNDLTKEQRAELNEPLSKALIVVTGLNKAAEDPEAMQKMTEQMGMPAEQMANLPEGTGLLDVIRQLPYERRMEITASAAEQFESLGQSMMTQSAIPLVKDEYEAVGIDVGQMQTHYILRIGAMMLLISLVAAASTITVGFIASKIGAGLARNLRRKVFGKVENFSNSEFDRYSTASLITRTTNDITQVQMVITMMLRMVIYAPIMGIGGTIYALNKSVSMSWIIALAVIILLSLMGSLFLIVMPKFKLVQKLIDRLNLVTRENLTGIMVSRAYNTQAFEEQRFDKANQDLTKTNLFVNRVMVCMMPAMMMIMNLVNLLIIWVGAHQVADAAMQVGDMMAYMQYAMQIVMSFLVISMMFIMIPRASVSAERIVDVLDTDIAIQDPENPVSLQAHPEQRGLVEFKNVSFKFPGAEEYTLHNISFTAKPGETTAFIGSTGSGKSTLVNLVPRFYDATEGEILVNGVNVKQAAQSDLHNQIGYVPQKGVLFTGTIASNLRYGETDAPDEAVLKAAEVAQAMEFIESKPTKFETPISQGGTNVSGGQKQRLSIARALVKKPPIYIFDDSFSALDFKTDAALRSALHTYTGDSTMLIVAQRVGTIRHAEQIIVLDEGEIVGKGTHDELMQNCEVYREIAYSQLRKEEL